MQRSPPAGLHIDLVTWPELSVILVTSDGGASIAKLMRHLEAQTIRERLDVIVAAPQGIELTNHSNAEPALRVRRVELPALATMASARAAAVEAATAPVIAFVEDHCFPEPDWAERLLAAHQEDFAAVGPLMRNANPATFTSRANLLVDYGPWTCVHVRTEMDHLPGHNSSYKRAILAGYGAKLESMLESESVLHWDLRARGFRLLLEPAVKVRHLNYSVLGDSLRLRWFCGRAFGSARGTRWPRWRRLLFAAAAPLIPWIRLVRIVRIVWQTPSSKRSIPGLIPVLILLLVADALGEGFGYLIGMGNARSHLMKLELHRDRHMRKEEFAAAFV